MSAFQSIGLGAAGWPIVVLFIDRLHNSNKIWVLLAMIESIKWPDKMSVSLVQAS